MSAQGDNHQSVDASLLQRRPSKPLKNVDDLYSRLGDPGRYQVIIFSLLCFHILVVASTNIIGVLFSYSPEHTCYADQTLAGIGTGERNESSSGNYSSLSTIHHSSPYTNNSLVLGSYNVTRTSCSVKAGNVTQRCSHGDWIYDVTGSETSTVTEFDLVCDDKHLNHLASTMYYVGVMLGGFVSGYISDVFGRHRVALVTLYCLALASAAVAFSNSYILFVVLRVLCGFFTMSLHTSSFILTVETFPAHHRSSAGTFIQISWGVGVMYLAGMSWLLQDWKHIQLSLLAPMIVAMVSVWFIPESVRWLLARGNTHRAHGVIKKFCRINSLSDPLKDENTALEDYRVHYVKGHATYLDLVRTPNMRKRTFFLGYIMFAANVSYYGLTFNTSLLAGSRYLNLFLAGATETLAYLLSALVTLKFGRKRPLIAVFITGAVCCIIAGVIPRDKNGNATGAEGIVITVFAVAGRMAMSSLFVINDIYCAELFPTVARNMAYGVCTFAGRVGAVISPQIFALANVTFYQLPPIVFATAAILGGILAFFLPETSGKHLPDTVEDVETNFGWNMSTRSNTSQRTKPDVDSEKHCAMNHIGERNRKEGENGTTVKFGASDSEGAQDPC